MRQAHRRWRPGPDTAIALTALVLAAGGVSWAAVGDSGNTVVACYGPASGPPGVQAIVQGTTCPGTDTAGVSWNQVGPQGAAGLVGPQGPPGHPGVNANPPIAGFVSQTFSDRFRVKLIIGSPGSYSIDGNVTEHVDTAAWPSSPGPVYGITCQLLTAPGGHLTSVDLETQDFDYFGAFKRYYPLTFDGPAGAGAVVDVASAPFTVEFQCITGRVKLSNPDYVSRAYNLPGVKFVDPAITADLSKTPHITIQKVAGPVGIH